MNKKGLTFLLIVLSLILLSAVAHGQTWKWGQRGQYVTKSIATDNNSNSYVLWPLGDQGNIDGHPLPCHGSTDMALTSFNCNGDYRWTKIIGGTAPDAGIDIGTDTLGGLYLLGNIGSNNSNTIYVDDDTTINPTLRRIVIIKYDTAGNFKWLRLPEPDTMTVAPPTGGGFNMTVTPDGNLYAFTLFYTGMIAEEVYQGSYPDGRNIHVLKYNKDGNFLGGVHLDITQSNPAISPYGFTYMYDAVMDRYYYAGQRMDPYQITLGTTAISGHNFLACFDNSGSALWVQKSNNDGIPTSFSGKPAVDESGNIYTTGYSYNDFNGGAGDGFGSYNFNNTIGVWGFPFLVKFDPSGNVMYATNASINTDNSGKNVAVINGIAAVSGEYGGGQFNWGGLTLGPNNQYTNIFLARFNAATGNILSIDTLASADMSYEYGQTIATDRKGSFYIGAELLGSAVYVANDTLYKEDGTSDGFIAKFATGDCNCILPLSSFSTTGAGLGWQFAYNGTTPVDSVTWSLGDNQSAAGLNISHTYSAPGTYTVCATAYNSCGTHQSCQDVTAANGNSIPNNPAFKGLIFGPNPVADALHLQHIPEGVSYKLFSLTGQTLARGKLATGNGKIDMQGQAAGCYLLLICDRNGNAQMIRVVKQ